MLNGVHKCYWGQKLYGAVRVLWKSCLSCSSAKTDSCLIIRCQLVWQSLANITVHSCWIRWGQLFGLNSKNCFNMVSYCSRTVHLFAIVVCKICCTVGTGRFWHTLPAVQIALHVITDCLYLFRTSFVYKVWFGRHYQHCSHCFFTSSEQGWMQSCNWSFNTQMEKAFWQCWWVHWLQEICVYDQEYQ